MKLDREDLRKYKQNQEWIKDQTEYIEEQKSIINKLTATISDMPKGSREVQDSMAEKLAKLMDCVNELLDKILKEEKQQKLILEQVNKVEQPYKLILGKAYIQGKSLVTVASEMKYNYEYMKRMHGIALNKFDEKGKL